MHKTKTTIYQTRSPYNEDVVLEQQGVIQVNGRTVFVAESRNLDNLKGMLHRNGANMSDINIQTVE